jgi:DNA polymerase-3 subunit alpha
MGVLQSSRFGEKLDGQFRPVKIAGIVTGRKFKVSDKGRFAFIQLSDLGGAFEVSVFNEGLLNQQRDALEVGKILLIGADGKMEESGPRFIAQSISLFDEALAKRQQTKGAGAFRIVVDQVEALEPIRTLLGEPNGRGSAVLLSARLQNERADIELPGKYTVSPVLLDKIRVLKGVISADEEAA